MSSIRTDFSADDTSRIWELLNPIGAAVNPHIQDTGTWNFAASNGTINGGTTSLSGGLYARRVGDIVTVQGNLTVTAGSSWIGKQWHGWNFAGIPDGFKPTFRNYEPGLGTWRGKGANFGLIYWGNTNQMLVLGSTITNPLAATDYFAFTCTWPTNQAFPADSAIPGTRVV